MTNREPGLVAQFCNPSYWEARTWDGLRSPGPQYRGLQRIEIRTLTLERPAEDKWTYKTALRHSRP
jgi:hypothetical protein